MTLLQRLLLPLLALGLLSAPLRAGLDTDDPKIVGAWRFLAEAEDYYYYVWNLKADGTYTIVLQTKAYAEKMQFSGTWRCRSKRIYCNCTYSSVEIENTPKFPNGDTIVELTENKLAVVEPGQYNRKVYIRLSEEQLRAGSKSDQKQR
jgi:hypothetical protein